MNLAAVGAIGAGRAERAERYSDLVEHALQAGEPPGPAEDNGVAIECVIMGLSREIERQGARHPVHSARKDLEVMEVGTAVGVEDQSAVQCRGAPEATYVLDRSAQVDDRVAPGLPDAVEGGGCVGEATAYS